MIISWNWLQEYVDLAMTREELEDRLAMSGLNHEGTERAADDWAIDLEVTSNRPDCLGHIGVAREVSVLWETPLKLPVPAPPEQGKAAKDSVRVSIEAEDLCRQYSARVIRGVKVGPSPDWLVDRLAAIGQPSVNNVVDITNYVLFECGQPLHAFDLSQLSGNQIIVRRARAGEVLEAIDHNSYELDESMCVIADDTNPVALAGIMGGAPTEVSSETTDLLIEAAEFSQLPTRNTARRLKLDSASSYRFERGIDPQGVDWASRRCCELILECCGGELEEGAVVAGAPETPPEPVVLRMAQISRILGIDVPQDETKRIMVALGFDLVEENDDAIMLQPPSWRRDCHREIDLIEEVARIHGYDQIPEDTRVPMATSRRTTLDRLLDRVRMQLVGAGFFEAMTRTVVPAKWNQNFNPWRSEISLVSQPAMVKGAANVRHSIVPSLLDSRKYNAARGVNDAELFETSRLFINFSDADRPREPWTLALVSSRPFRDIKGILEELGERLECQVTTGAQPEPLGLLAPGRSATLLLNGKPWGVIGEVSDDGLKQFKLKQGATVAELSLDLLSELARLVPQDQDISNQPAMDQDMNFIVPESLTWAELAAAVEQSAGALLETLHYKETYRDPKQDGAERKRLLFNVVLRAADKTLTKEEAEEVRTQIVAGLEPLGGKLLG